MNISNVDEACNEWKSLEAEKEKLESLKAAGEFKEGIIIKKIDAADITSINARIAAINIKLDGMITKTNTDLSKSIETIIPK